MPGLNPGPKSRIKIRHYRPLLQESITFLQTILSISPSFPGSRGPPGTSRDRLLAPSQRFFGGWAPGTSPGPQYGRWAMGHQVGVPPGALAHPFPNRFLCPWVRWKATDWGFPAHLGVQKTVENWWRYAPIGGFWGFQDCLPDISGTHRPFSVPLGALEWGVLLLSFEPLHAPNRSLLPFPLPSHPLPLLPLPLLPQLVPSKNELVYHVIDT